MAIIEYDKSLNITPEQRLKSLADSVRRAFEEVEQSEGNGGAMESITPPIYINNSKKGVRVGGPVSQDGLSVAWDAYFEKDIYIEDSELIALWETLTSI